MRSVKRIFEEAKFGVRSMNRRNPNILIFILYGLLYDVVINIWKPFNIKFLLRLGGNAADVSLLNALPGLVAALTLVPCSIFIARFSKKKKITSIFFFISRFILLMVAFVPFLPPVARPMLFILLLSLMNFPDAVSQTALQSVLGNLFDGRMRAEAISLRNQFGNIAIPMITIITGLIIDWIPKTDAQRIQFYQIFFAGAFLIGLLEIFVFNRFRERETDFVATAPVNVGILKSVFVNKTFLRYFMTTLPFIFFWQAGWPLCGLYQAQNLNATEAWFAAFAVAMGLGNFCFSGFWKKFIYKRGNNTAMWLAFALMAINMIGYPLSPNLFVMTIWAFLSGLPGAGVNITTLNGLLGATPEENKLVYLGVYNSFYNVSLFFASLFSFAMLQWAGIVIAFYILAAGRLASAFVIFLVNRKQNIL